MQTKPSVRFFGRVKADSLPAQIKFVGVQVSNHQGLVAVRTTALINSLQKQMTKPTTLLTIGSIGFIIGELTNKCYTPNKSVATGKVSSLNILFQLITAIQTVSLALPTVVWIIQLLQKKPLIKSGNQQKPCQVDALVLNRKKTTNS